MSSHAISNLIVAASLHERKAAQLSKLCGVFVVAGCVVIGCGAFLVGFGMIGLAAWFGKLSDKEKHRARTLKDEATELIARELARPNDSRFIVHADSGRILN